MEREWRVEIPNWQNYYLRSKAIRPKYYKVEKLPKTRLAKWKAAGSKLIGGYPVDENLERFISNPRKAGEENRWILNGQEFYNQKLDWRLRKNIALWYHEYFSDFIKAQLRPIAFGENDYLSVSCDIYEIKRDKIPDASNMWPLEKFFEDALQECNIIPDDNPDYVRESGRKRYHWVENPEDRKLVFTLKFL